jgi:hypothetical protein
VPHNRTQPETYWLVASQATLCLGSRYEYQVQVGSQPLTTESARDGASGDITLSVDAADVTLYIGDVRPQDVREAQEFADFPV